jgi:hypothetical protein
MPINNQRETHFFGVDLFALESLQENLATGVVVWASRPAYARDHPVVAKHLYVFLAGTLHPLIVIVNKPWEGDGEIVASDIVPESLLLPLLFAGLL